MFSVLCILMVQAQNGKGGPGSSTADVTSEVGLEDASYRNLPEARVALQALYALMKAGSTSATVPEASMANSCGCGFSGMLGCLTLALANHRPPLLGHLLVWQQFCLTVNFGVTPSRVSLQDSLDSARGQAHPHSQAGNVLRCR